MQDETTIVTKTATTTDEKSPDSSVFGVSVRGWIVITLVGTLCLMQLLNMILSYLVSGDIILEIKEPFYSAVTISIGYYFGQNTKKSA